MVETNKIIELFEGHYQVILDLPEKPDLLKIIDLSFQYVWIFGHTENEVEWSDYKHSLYGVFDDLSEVKMRNAKMEVLLKSEMFFKYIPYISQTVKIVQTNIIPPYYLNLDSLDGKSRYDLLRSKVDYLFELVIPGAIDYSRIVSPDKKFLERILKVLK